jgi:hypothetical protein
LLHRLKLKRISRKDVRNGPLECLFAIFATVGDNQAAKVTPAVSVVAKKCPPPAALGQA